MARFDVYPNLGVTAKTTPFLLDVQSDLLDGLDSAVVIPLRPLAQFIKAKPPERLMPIIKIKGRNYVLETPKLAAVPRKALKNPVTSISSEHDTVMAAIDFLFQGY